MKGKLSVIICVAFFVSSMFVMTGAARGKTYDDLDEILKSEGLNSTKTHVAYKEPMDEGARIDPSKVIKAKKPQIQEDKAMTSGLVIPRGYISTSPTARQSSKTVEQFARKSDKDKASSFPLSYLRIPKR